jgi:ABC-type polar amino acid transport system ATPase subunit
VAEGERFLAVRAPSGSGKSIMIRCTNQWERQQRGGIRIQGRAFGGGARGLLLQPTL